MGKGVVGGGEFLLGRVELVGEVGQELAGVGDVGLVAVPAERPVVLGDHGLGLLLALFEVGDGPLGGGLLGLGVADLARSPLLPGFGQFELGGELISALEE